MWSLVELWTPSDLVAHSLKCVLPSPYNLIQHSFLWRFCGGLFKFFLEAWIWHQDSCYGLNQLFYHGLDLHVNQGWILVINNVVVTSQMILRIWSHLSWEQINITLYSDSMTATCTMHLCLVFIMLIYCKGLHRWLVLILVEPYNVYSNHTCDRVIYDMTILLN